MKRVAQGSLRVREPQTCEASCDTLNGDIHTSGPAFSSVLWIANTAWNAFPYAQATCRLFNLAAFGARCLNGAFSVSQPSNPRPCYG